MASTFFHHGHFTGPIFGGILRPKFQNITPLRSFIRHFPRQTHPQLHIQAAEVPRRLSDATAQTSILQQLSSRILLATHRSGSVWRLRSKPSSSNWGGGSSPGGGGSPWKRFRQSMERIPSNYILYSIMGGNILVFGLWQFATMEVEVRKRSSWYIWMRNNFTVSMHNLQSGRIWTLLTAAMSHEGFVHLAFNLFTFFYMAPPVLSLLGNVAFLGLYFGGGIVCSLTSVFWRRLHDPNPYHASLGASGAIYSVISFFTCLAPTTTFMFYGIIPVPAWLFLSGIFLWDGYSAATGKQSTTDSAGHIGGLLAGVAYFLMKRFRIM
ncbi:hypothetical protein C8Q75DRAFT_808340 [Abortiporus biennis]|nr:hypothetical protein C8Q75DRAFT_808340 [Abortiporus biennis]